MLKRVVLAPVLASQLYIDQIAVQIGRRGVLVLQQGGVTDCADSVAWPHKMVNGPQCRELVWSTMKSFYRLSVDRSIYRVLVESYQHTGRGRGCLAGTTIPHTNEESRISRAGKAQCQSRGQGCGAATMQFPSMLNIKIGFVVYLKHILSLFLLVLSSHRTSGCTITSACEGPNMSVVVKTPALYVKHPS